MKFTPVPSNPQYLLIPDSAGFWYAVSSGALASGIGRHLVHSNTGVESLTPLIA